MKRLLLALLLMFSMSCSGKPASIPAHSAFFTIGIRTFHITRVPSYNVAVTNAMGSGVSIGSDGGSTYVLTAAHLCDAATRTKTSYSYPPVLLRSVGKPRPYMGIPVKSDKASDLCLLKVPGLVLGGVNLDTRPPRYREKVYMHGSPYGYYQPGVVLPIEGRYAGTFRNRSVYTTPCASGCSGGPILAQNGRLVGIYVSVHRGFNRIGFSPTYEKVRTFVREAKNQFNIR